MILPEGTILKFRDLARRATPPWLQIGTAARIIYAITVQLDAAADAVVAGVKLRFPNVYTDESLPLIGRERRIRRGLTEDAEPYAVRLRRWLLDHRRRGGPYAMLEQLFHHYDPNTFPISLYYRSGMRFDMDTDGVITRTYGSTPNTAAWSRWTLIYYTDDYGAGDAVDLAVIPREWIAAHVLGLLVVLPTGAELWDYPPDLLWNQSGQWDTADLAVAIPITPGA